MNDASRRGDHDRTPPHPAAAPVAVVSRICPSSPGRGSGNPCTLHAGTLSPRRRGPVWSFDPARTAQNTERRSFVGEETASSRFFMCMMMASPRRTGARRSGSSRRPAWGKPRVHRRSWATGTGEGSRAGWPVGGTPIPRHRQRKGSLDGGRWSCLRSGHGAAARGAGATPPWGGRAPVAGSGARASRRPLVSQRRNTTSVPFAARGGE